MLPPTMQIAGESIRASKGDNRRVWGPLLNVTRIKVAASFCLVAASFCLEVQHQLEIRSRRPSWTSPISGGVGFGRRICQSGTANRLGSNFLACDDLATALAVRA